MGATSAAKAATTPAGRRWARLRRHLTARDLGLLGFSLLLGRATLMGVSPLAIGGMVAARGLFGSWSLAMALAACLGVVSARGLAGVVSVALLLALFPLWGALRRLVPSTFLGPLLAAGLGALAPLPHWSPWASFASALMTTAAALGLGYLEAPLIQRDTLLSRGAAAAALGLVAAAGLVGVRPAGFDLAYALVVALALSAVVLSPAGASVAPLAGLMLALRGDIPLVGVVDLALGATLGALGRGFGRLAQAGLFLVGDELLAAGHLSPDQLLRQAVAASAGCLAVALASPRWLERPPPEREQGAAKDRGLAGRLSDVAYLLRELAVTFYEAVHQERDGPPYAAVLETVDRRVCQGCRHHASCWQDGFYATYRSVVDLAADRHPGQPINAEDLPAELRRKCPRPREVALALSFAVDLEAAESGWNRREREMRALAADQIRGAAAVLERMGEELLVPPLPKDRLLSYATGLAKLAKGGGAVSGDSYLVRELADGRLVLGLADGMGVGPKAFLESSAVVSMVEKLLALGLGQELVLRTVNAALLMRSREDMFSTLDLALIDLTNGEAELVKIGSAPTFLCHGQEVEVLTSRSVPIGILREVQWEVFYRRLSPGDLVVMVSDGVAEVGGHSWLAERLPELAPLDPQEVAERLLDEALERAGRRRDDMTVLATALADAESDAAPEIQAWVRRSFPPASISMEHAGNTGQARGR